MFKIKFVIFTIFIFLFTFKSISEINIILKVNQNIITNIDLKEEKKYLTFLRPSLKQLSEDELVKFSKNSLIREAIKKKEIDLIFKNINEEKLREKLVSRLIKFKKAKNEEEILKIIEFNKLNYEKVINKLKYEALWNEYIYQKYIKSVKIDKNNLKKELNKKILNNKKFEYNLSEILFDINKDEDFEKKKNKILNSIKDEGFRKTAIKFSISESSTNGGNIGWIKETLLSNSITKVLDNMQVGNISNPIRYPNGFLILKVDDKKIIREKIDIDKELDEAIKFEENKQLQQFSLLLYKRLKQNTIINEF